MTQWQVGDGAPDAVLRTLQGDQIALSTLWHGHGLILTFLRHFG